MSYVIKSFHRILLQAELFGHPCALQGFSASLSWEGSSMSWTLWQLPVGAFWEITTNGSDEVIPIDNARVYRACLCGSPWWRIRQKTQIPLPSFAHNQACKQDHHPQLNQLVLHKSLHQQRVETHPQKNCHWHPMPTRRIELCHQGHCSRSVFQWHSMK